jgi:ParB/RepB/Spo0J family partition protein
MEIVMTYIQRTPTQHQLIPVTKLEKSPLNARRTNVTMGMEELKASLLAHGLLQNLVVTDAGDGTYRVIAGGRRLEAIHSLQAEGKLPEDFAVPCQIVTEEQAPEMSLAENMVRLAMHPADQFEAFATLIDQGASAAEVAARFGIEESLVQKRMKLARVAPQLLAEYRNEGMSELLCKRPVLDGPDVKFIRSRAKPGGELELTSAASTLTTIEQALPTDWLKATSEAARFEAFRSLPEATKLELLAYLVALSLKPNLAPAEPEDATAYDAALSLTAASVAEYWRPTKSNFLGRITRDQLLAVSREVLGEAWAQSRFGEKKTLLVEQLDRAFAHPEQSGRTASQVEKLKSWLPGGMSFEAVPAVKPAKAKKTKLAA